MLSTADGPSIDDLLAMLSTADGSIDDLLAVLSTADGSIEDLLTMLSTAEGSLSCGEIETWPSIIVTALLKFLKIYSYATVCIGDPFQHLSLYIQL